MNVSVICFTPNGYDRMKELNSIAFEDISIEMFCKCSRLKEECADIYVEEDLSSWTKKQFEKKNAILFIGAAGIAVRAIADSVENKLTDSPVLVMDDRGEYIISLLSGHVGGANELAMTIAGRTGSVPVITTATDINGKFAADVFAKKNGLSIVNKGGIAMVSSKVLAGEKVSICIGEEIPADEEAKAAFAKKHEEDLILLAEKDAGETCDIFIGKKKETSPKALLYLEVAKYVLGIGCRKGKREDEIQTLADRVLSERGISPREVCAVASVVGKHEEEGLIAFARDLQVPFVTYPAADLESLEGDFSESEFVRQTIGTGCVSERAAMYHCKGEGTLILKKTAENGVTAAIAEKKWRLKFYE